MRIFSILLAIILSLPICRGQEFDYPSIPDTLVSAQERIDYLSCHFWDNCDFSSVQLFRDNPKTILDYCYLLRNQSVSKQHQSIQTLVSLSSEQTESFLWITYWFKHFFHDCRSTYYDDELFLVFLEESLNASIDESLRTQAEFLLPIVQRNRIGEYAENINFQTKDGRIHCLREYDSTLTMLIFTNPSCQACHDAQLKISESENINNSLSQGDLQIIAINPGLDYDLWFEMDYPASWVIGYDHEDSIRTKQLYDIQFFPAYYLLDEEKRVILKQTSLIQIESLLSNGRQ